jgi:hypothetical protein
MTQEELMRYESVINILYELEQQMAVIKSRLKALEEQNNA